MRIGQTAALPTGTCASGSERRISASFEIREEVAVSVSVVVGGQFGSEGKGKVAHHLAVARRAAAVVRVGGSNSGHTAIARNGRREVLRQLPTAALEPDVTCVLPAGSYVDVEVLQDELERLELDPGRLLVDANAMVISADDRETERAGDLGIRIGSTCSGTGASVAKRVARRSSRHLASASQALRPYIGDATAYLRDLLDRGDRVIVEGTQGFGLSLLHSRHFPNVTSRDTSAAGAVSEAGLSPLDVDEVVLVLRAFPIRVAGNSGEFGSEEIDWATVAREGGHPGDLAEYTSVTGRLRRVARFDADLVRQAIAVNRPTMLVLNHVDHIDASSARGTLTEPAQQFVGRVAADINRPIDLVGLGPDLLVPWRPGVALAA